MKYYRQVIQIEILSADEPLAWDSLNDIGDAISDGHHSGVMEEVASEVVGEFEMAELLAGQGSDPDFLIDNWNEIPEDYLRVEDGEEV